MAVTARNPKHGFQFRRAEQRVSQEGFRELRNADLYADGVIGKAAGFTATTDRDLDFDNPLPGTLQGVGYHGNDLVRLQDQDLYAYAPASDRWNRQGPWPVVNSYERTRVVEPRSIRTMGAAELDGYRVTVWQDYDQTNFSIWASVSTLEGATLGRYLLFGPAATLVYHPRAVNCGEWIAITYYVDDPFDEIRIRRWHPDDPLTISLHAAVAAAPGYDLVGMPDRGELLIARLVGGVPRLTEVRPDLSIDRDRVIPGLPAGVDVLAADRWTPTAETLVAGVENSAVGGAAVWLDDALAIIASHDPLVQGVRATCVFVGATLAFVGIEAEPTRQLETFSLARDGTVRFPVSAVHRAYGLALAGRAAAWAGEAYFPCIYPDQLGELTTTGTNLSSYFAIRGRDLAIVGRAAPLGQATGWGGRFTVEEFCLGQAVYRDGGFSWWMPYRTTFVFADAGGGSASGYESIGSEVATEWELDFARARAKLVEHQGIAVWPRAGFLSGYDGRRTFEVDFHLPPEIVSFNDLGAGGPIDPGDYGYAVTYGWRDENGRIYRSLVATDQHTVPPVAPAGIVDIEVRTLRQTERNDIFIEVWRTTRVGTLTSTTYFLVTDPSYPVFNDLVANTVTIRDQIPDANLTNNEQLTLEPAGPELGHDIVQVSGWATSAGERLWARSTVLPNRVQASLFGGDRQGLAMSSLIQRDVDTSAEVRGLAIQDGSFFAAAADSVHVFGGRGLDNASVGQSFTPPVVIPSTEGCSLLGGIVRTAMGILYASDDGPALLTRDQMAISPTADVRELYRDGLATITDIAWLPSVGEIWFGDVDTTLVLNSDTLRWTQRDRVATRSIAVSRAGAMALARTDGRVLVLGTAGDTRIADVDTPLVVMPGFQRPSATMLAPYSLTTIGLVLLYHDPHLLHVELYLDDDPDTIRGTVTIDPDRDGLRVPEAWGEAPPSAWGDTQQPWGWANGWPGNAYYVKIQVNSPVIRSATIRMQDSGTTRRGWSLVQTIWGWESRQVTDGIDEGDPQGRRRYTISVQ